MSAKTRLDVLLVERGLMESRQKAQSTIMSGLVFVNQQRVDKPGTAVANDAEIEVRGNVLRYVSRGGLKLEKAMATFPISLDGAVCGDIGASTGGFTDCCLQHGAKKVVAIDVGTNVMHPSLRNNPKVELHENTNIVDVSNEKFAQANLVVVDVSFVSLERMRKMVDAPFSLASLIILAS